MVQLVISPEAGMLPGQDAHTLGGSLGSRATLMCMLLVSGSCFKGMSEQLSRFIPESCWTPK